MANKTMVFCNKCEHRILRDGFPFTSAVCGALPRIESDFWGERTVYPVLCGVRNAHNNCPGYKPDPASAVASKIEPKKKRPWYRRWL